MQQRELKKNSHIFKALGHNKRLEIACLLQGHQLTVNQIAQMTALRQATVSQHLIILKELDLVCTEKIGKEIYYLLCASAFTALSHFVKNLSRITPIEDAEPSVVDPVCHMTLTPSLASYTHLYNGARQYFCGKGCLTDFKKGHL